jgi:peptidoglycan/LPS O-acetylase OafA/YrhL
LCVEEQFYLIFPLLVFLVPKKQIAFMCEIIVIIGILFRCCAVMFSGNIYLVSISPISQIDLLALGVLLSCRERNLLRHTIVKKMIKHSLIIGLAGLVITIGIVGVINGNFLQEYSLCKQPE